jgi:hypothetical protein
LGGDRLFRMIDFNVSQCRVARASSPSDFRIGIGRPGTARSRSPESVSSPSHRDLEERDVHEGPVQSNVAFPADQPPYLVVRRTAALAWYAHRFERLLAGRDLGRPGRCAGHSHRNTRAPVHSTHRLPSKQGRFDMGFGPPLGDAFGSGNNGSIRLHCSSMSSRRSRGRATPFVVCLYFPKNLSRNSLCTDPSFPRKRESSGFQEVWTPACAGVSGSGIASKSSAGKSLATNCQLSRYETGAPE